MFLRAWILPAIIAFTWLFVGYLAYVHDKKLEACVDLGWSVYYVCLARAWRKEQLQRERDRLMSAIAAYFWQGVPFPLDLSHRLGLDFENRLVDSEQIIVSLLQQELLRSNIHMNLVELSRQKFDAETRQIDKVAIDCQFYSKSFFLKCAINPSSLCQDCLDYVKKL